MYGSVCWSVAVVVGARGRGDGSWGVVGDMIAVGGGGEVCGRCCWTEEIGSCGGKGLAMWDMGSTINPPRDVGK